MWSFHFYDCVESTMDVAKEAGAQGAPGRTGFVALRQTGGRGRKTRHWSSPLGGLWMTLLLRPQVPVERWSLSTLAVGVAVARMLRSYGVDAYLKWPNDIQIRGRKVCGILCESVFGEGASAPGTFLVAGIGLNLNIHPSAFPAEISEIATSVLAETHRILELRQTAEEIATNLDITMSWLESGEYQRLRDEWRSLCPMLGEKVRVLAATGEFTGTALDIDEDGALLVETQDGVKRVVAADVSVRLSDNR